MAVAMEAKRRDQSIALSHQSGYLTRLQKPADQALAD
jgi:hypothetical protein